MEQLFLKQNWKKKIQSDSVLWETSIIILLCLAFVLSDWMLGIFSFSDYLFGALFIIMLFSNNFKIVAKQLKWIGLIVGIVLLNVILNVSFNDFFVLKTGVAGVIKSTFYIVTIIALYNFINRNNLQRKVLRSMNITAVVICLIGIYINIALYLDGILPYEFFWYFTRTDSISYLFEGTENLYRIRSLFSEPSYLGYYLLVILGINLFNNQQIKSNIVFIFVLIVTILFTFSYSSVAVLMILIILKLFNKKTYNLLASKKINYFYLGVLLIVFSVLIFIFQDIIQATIIDRTYDILAGKDSSAYARLLESWQYVNQDNILMGNGIGHTPDIWNVYAYLLSDLGLIAFIGMVMFSLYLIKKNYGLGILFVALNFQKGGYLSSSFYIFVLLLLIFSTAKCKNE